MTDAAAIRPRRKSGRRGSRGRPRSAPNEEPLRITVTNGDLTFEPEALLLGHYQAMQLTGTEKVMDGLIGGAMKRSLDMGVYPVAIGSHQIFINTRPNLERGTFMPRPKAVIVVGLGEEGKLRAADLAQSVRQAVIAWAQRLAENKKHGPPFFKLAADADWKRRHGRDGRRRRAPHRPGRVRSERAPEGRARQRRPDGRASAISISSSSTWTARPTRGASLRLQEAATPGRYAIADAVKPGTGPLQRPPDSGYRGAELRLHHGRNEGGEGRRAADFLHARHEACPQRGARTADAERAPPRARGDRVERSEPRSADWPHVVQPADSRRARGLPGRQRRDADRARSGDGEDSVGAARHEERVRRADRRGRFASSCSASCASRIPRARHRCRRRRQRARDRRAGVSQGVSAALRRAQRGPCRARLPDRPARWTSAGDGAHQRRSVTGRFERAGRSSTRCSRSRGESCTSPGMGCLANTASRAASCSRTGPFSVPTSSATCARFPSWCS